MKNNLIACLALAAFAASSSAFASDTKGCCAKKAAVAKSVNATKTGKQAKATVAKRTAKKVSARRASCCKPGAACCKGGACCAAKA